MNFVVCERVHFPIREKRQWAWIRDFNLTSKLYAVMGQIHSVCMNMGHDLAYGQRKETYTKGENPKFAPNSFASWMMKWNNFSHHSWKAKQSLAACPDLKPHPRYSLHMSSQPCAFSDLTPIEMRWKCLEPPHLQLSIQTLYNPLATDGLEKTYAC